MDDITAAAEGSCSWEGNTSARCDGLVLKARFKDRGIRGGCLVGARRRANRSERVWENVS